VYSDAPDEQHQEQPTTGAHGFRLRAHDRRHQEPGPYREQNGGWIEIPAGVDEPSTRLPARHDSRDVGEQRQPQKERRGITARVRPHHPCRGEEERGGGYHQQHGIGRIRGNIRLVGERLKK
jgi:hypothetical protein